MKTFDSKRFIRLALTPVACATLLAACAYDTPSYPVVYDPPRATIPGPVTTLSAFDRLDINRDGFLSKAELEPLGVPPVVAAPVGVPGDTPAAAFARLDTNRDGFLSRAEAGNMFSTIPGGSFDSFDTNRDGYLSMTEAMPHMQYLYRGTPSTAWSFEALDRDRDGFLSRAEAAPLLASVYWADGRWTWNTVPARTTSFDALDTNRDGFISRAEAAGAMDTVTFNRFDTNRDGFLSRVEAEPFMRWGVGASTDPYYGGTVYGPRY